MFRLPPGPDGSSTRRGHPAPRRRHRDTNAPPRSNGQGHRLGTVRYRTGRRSGWCSLDSPCPPTGPFRLGRGLNRPPGSLSPAFQEEVRHVRLGTVRTAGGAGHTDVLPGGGGPGDRQCPAGRPMAGEAKASRERARELAEAVVRVAQEIRKPVVAAQKDYLGESSGPPRGGEASGPRDEAVAAGSARPDAGAFRDARASSSRSRRLSGESGQAAACPPPGRARAYLGLSKRAAISFRAMSRCAMAASASASSPAASAPGAGAGCARRGAGTPGGGASPGPRPLSASGACAAAGPLAFELVAELADLAGQLVAAPPQRVALLRRLLQGLADLGDLGLVELLPRAEGGLDLVAGGRHLGPLLGQRLDQPQQRLPLAPEAVGLRVGSVSALAGRAPGGLPRVQPGARPGAGGTGGARPRGRAAGVRARRGARGPGRPARRRAAAARRPPASPAAGPG